MRFIKGINKTMIRSFTFLLFVLSVSIHGTELVRASEPQIPSSGEGSQKKKSFFSKRITALKEWREDSRAENNSKDSPSSKSSLPPADVVLSREEIEVYQSRPPEDQPIVPLENTFVFRGQRSTSYTLRMIKALDRDFFVQTGGGDLGINRNIGTAKMLALIRKTLETGKHHLTDEEMNTYATSQLLAYLHEEKKPRINDFVRSLTACETHKTSCSDVITFDELYGFIEKQKHTILSKVKNLPPRKEF